jgi:hypothetical protein
MGQLLLGWLALIAVAGASANLALAQTSADYSSIENSTKNLVAMCNRWRVSESPLNSPARKLLGKSNDAVCRDIAAKWSPRFVEWFQAKDTPPRAFAEVCRDVAERMAGRPVEVAWCSSWDQIPDVPIPLPTRWAPGACGSC